MPRALLLLLGLLTLMLLPSLAVPARPPYAATIVVTTTADEFDAMGSGTGCSLREAIQAANTDAAFGGCNAGGGDDTITLPAGTYLLTIPGIGEYRNATGDLDISSNMTIAGAGAVSTIIDVNHLDRVVHVLGPVTVTISGVTMTNGGGPAFGGISNDGGTVTIADNTVNGSSAGDGIYNTGGGTVRLTGSTVSGHAATSSGGIYIAGGGTVSITTSTLSGNLAIGGASGGGFHED